MRAYNHAYREKDAGASPSGVPTMASATVKVQTPDMTYAFPLLPVEFSKNFNMDVIQILDSGALRVDTFQNSAIFAPDTWVTAQVVRELEMEDQK